jgi:hypothetical protein
MKVELLEHKGIRHDGIIVEFDQWQVFATGPDGNRVLVGYLSHKPELPLMLLCNQPSNVLKELIEKCSAIVGREVLSPVPIVEPPQIDNSQGEDNDEDE